MAKRYTPVGKGHGGVWWLCIGIWYWAIIGWWVEPIRWMMAPTLKPDQRPRPQQQWQQPPVVVHQQPDPRALEEAALMRQRRQMEAADYQRRVEASKPLVCQFCKHTSPPDSVVCTNCGASPGSPVKTAPQQHPAGRKSRIDQAREKAAKRIAGS